MVHAVSRKDLPFVITGIIILFDNILFIYLYCMHYLGICNPKLVLGTSFFTKKITIHIFGK